MYIQYIMFLCISYYPLIVNWILTWNFNQKSNLLPIDYFHSFISAIDALYGI